MTVLLKIIKNYKKIKVIKNKKRSNIGSFNQIKGYKKEHLKKVLEILFSF